jgi:carboxypeptidase D
VAPTAGNIDQPVPSWQPRIWDDSPVRLKLPDQQAVADLLARVPLREFSREDLVPTAQGWILTVRVTPQEAAALTRAGQDFEVLPDLDRAGRLAAETAWAAGLGDIQPTPGFEKSDAPAVTTYPTHPQIGALLANLAASYPDICRTVSWGQSVQGRELWGVVISADVNNTAAEPEVRLSSSMHGDEVVGMVLLLNLAHHLAQNYGQPGYAAVTSLLDNTEIHLLPLHNPDGYVAGTRRNANGVDLNRNYALPTGSDPVQELENLNYMAYAEAHHFVLGGNGHGGALVVNYPWDHTDTLAPDDAAFIQLSLAYSTTNLPMYNSLSFSQGITNGADWYRVDGGLQDWAYDQTGSFDVTIEQSNIKWPAASTLTGFWNDNRASLLNFIAASHYGIHGVVTDSLGGGPLSAVVDVSGGVRPVSTDPAHGDYYKLLATGSYELTFTAEGYRAKTVSGVSTTWGSPTVLDVQMSPLATPAADVPALKTAVAAWPNPFNPVTKLAVTVPTRGPLAVGIYDLRGRRMRILLNTESEPGLHAVGWDGRDDDGVVVPSGVYFARAQTRDGVATAKLVLAK